MRSAKVAYSLILTILRTINAIISAAITTIRSTTVSHNWTFGKTLGLHRKLETKAQMNNTSKLKVVHSLVSLVSKDKRRLSLEEFHSMKCRQSKTAKSFVIKPSQKTHSTSARYRKNSHRLISLTFKQPKRVWRWKTSLRLNFDSIF